MSAITRKSIPRRTFLRGGGRALASRCWTAMIRPFRRKPSARSGIVVHRVPTEIMMDKWTPATEGANFALMRCWNHSSRSATACWCTAARFRSSPRARI